MKARDVHRKSKISVIVKRALAEILPICMFSLLIAALVCSVANDMYAFVKKENEVTLTFFESCSLEEFSKSLGENDVVANPAVFYLYVKAKDKTETVENFTGELVLNANMSYREILSELS